MDVEDSPTCPYCGQVVENTHDEVAHMNDRHPDVVAERLRNAGFREVDGEWVDTMAEA